MPENPREYLRAAQAAEIRGDKGQAAKLLERAADLYRSAGNEARAEQMLRHARRLAGEPTEDLTEGGASTALGPSGVEGGGQWSDDPGSIRSLLVAPERPGGNDEASEQAATAGRMRRLIERQLTRADPSLDAWCSFCCEPRAAVGELVAGPAGAFICRRCLGAGAALLGAGTAEGPNPFRPGEVEAPRRPVQLEPGPIDLVGQLEAVRAIDEALRLGARLVMLLGPVGCGKTTYLRDRALRGEGSYVENPEALTGADLSKPLLVEIEGWEPAALGALREAARRGPVIAAMRGNAPVPLLSLEGEGRAFALSSTRAIEQACGGRLPIAVSEAVQVVAVFQPLTRAELIEVARRMVARRPGVDVSDAVLAAAAAEAERSGRGGHELEALIGRIPPGAWTVRGSAPKRAPRRKGGSRRS